MATGEPEGGGECLTEFEVLAPQDVREGISGAQVISEFHGTMWTSELQWVGSVSNGVSDGTIEFEEKGSATTIAMTIEHDGEEIRFFEAGGTGSTGCAARIVVDVELEVTTADGILNVVRPAELVRSALTDEEMAEYGLNRAAIQLDLDATEDMAGLEVTALSPEPAEPLQPALLTGFRQDGSWDGSITASYSVSTGSGLATGYTVVFAEW